MRGLQEPRSRVANKKATGPHVSGEDIEVFVTRLPTRRTANAFALCSISRLRHRIETTRISQRIKTVRGGGYVFAAPITLNGAEW